MARSLADVSALDFFPLDPFSGKHPRVTAASTAVTADNLRATITTAVDAAFATALTPSQPGHQPTAFQTAVTTAVDAALATALTPSQPGHQPAAFEAAVTTAVDAAFATALTPSQPGHQPTRFEAGVQRGVQRGTSLSCFQM